MKPDFLKILADAPRHGGGTSAPKGYLKQFQNTDVEDLPKSENMRRKWQSDLTCKEQDSNGKPFIRFLRSRVGQKWDDVYSEIRKNVDCNSVFKKYTTLLDYISYNVTVNTITLNGEHCYAEGMIHGYPIRDGFYVNPDNGVLEYIPAKRHKKSEKEFLWYDKAKLQQFIKIANLWYIVQLIDPEDRTFNLSVYGAYYDPATKRYHCEYDLRQRYGGRYVIDKKIKQCSGKEIKKFGLNK